MKIGRSNGVQKCTICMRKKREAIDEQVKKGKPCDTPNCPFCSDIQKAIAEEQNKPKFTFGKTKFTFGKK